MSVFWTLICAEKGDTMDHTVHRKVSMHMSVWMPSWNTTHWTSTLFCHLHTQSQRWLWVGVCLGLML